VRRRKRALKEIKQRAKAAPERPTKSSVSPAVAPWSVSMRERTRFRPPMRFSCRDAGQTNKLEALTSYFAFNPRPAREPSLGAELSKLSGAIRLMARRRLSFARVKRRLLRAPLHAPSPRQGAYRQHHFLSASAYGIDLVPGPRFDLHLAVAELIEIVRLHVPGTASRLGASLFTSIAAAL
jgi:hypothetical protein